MRRTGVSDAIAAGLLVVCILIGVTGYYVATTYQTKTVTRTETATTRLTSTATVTVPPTATRTVLATTTSVSLTITTSIVSVYPVPENVTLAFTNVDGEYNYNIQAGSSSSSGALSGPNTLHITGLFQGQTISITASTTGAGGCRMGEHFTMELFVNGQMAAQSSSFCLGNQASITYTV